MNRDDYIMCREQSRWSLRTCRVEQLDGIVVKLECCVGFDACETNDVVAVVVELHKPISDDVVRQADIVHDQHAAVHLTHTTRRAVCTS